MKRSLPKFSSPDEFDFTYKVFSPQVIKTVLKNTEKLMLAILLVYDKSKDLKIKARRYITAPMLFKQESTEYWNPYHSQTFYSKIERFHNIFDFLFVEKYPEYRDSCLNFMNDIEDEVYESKNSLIKILKKEYGDEEKQREKLEELNRGFIYFLEALISNFYAIGYGSPEEFKKNLNPLIDLIFQIYDCGSFIDSPRFLFNWKIWVGPMNNPLTYTKLLVETDDPILTDKKSDYRSITYDEKIPD